MSLKIHKYDGTGDMQDNAHMVKESKKSMARKMESKTYTNVRCGHCGKFGHHHSRHLREGVLHSDSQGNRVDQRGMYFMNDSDAENRKRMNKGYTPVKRMTPNEKRIAREHERANNSISY